MEKELELKKQVPANEAQEQPKAPTYQEIPGLIFSQVMGTDVFDVDHFISTLEGNVENVNVEQYLKERDRQISYACEKLSLDKKHVVLKLEGEPTMMNAVFGLDFVCWAVPGLLFYAYERLHDVFVNGFSVSDRYLGEVVSTRFSPEQKEELLAANKNA